ncbi:MAG TPA: hypothetical protein VFH54_19550 [Mycobacteriales bacterium]|nr:hypothetical protein [Mycobacteriales bacterium]
MTLTELPEVQPTGMPGDPTVLPPPTVVVVIDGRPTCLDALAWAAAEVTAMS